MLAESVDEEQIIERVAAVDIGKAELAAVSGSPEQAVRRDACRRSRRTRR